MLVVGTLHAWWARYPPPPSDAAPVSVYAGPLEAKQLMEAAVLAHKVARLEMGESTSNAATFDVTSRDEQLASLQRRMAELQDDDTQGPAAQ